MDRRNFIAAGISAVFFALVPWLRPKDEMVCRLTVDRPKPISVQEYEAWANQVSLSLIRGYDLRWQIGQHTNILDESLLRAGTTAS